jgi:CBS domain-containing protein
MASNPECCGTLNEWSKRFFKWIKSPTPQAMLNCKIFFDLRFIDGSNELYNDLCRALERISKNELFFAAMATDINANSVPIGLFQQFKLEKNESKHKYLDLKKRGVVIINDLARLYALKAGVRRANTLERLDALTKFNLISKKDIYNLKDCWRYLTQLRLKTQLNKEGLSGNCIDPEMLTSLEKHQLKEAFYLIKQAQQACAFKFARGSL